jgi:hypothetical protein
MERVKWVGEAVTLLNTYKEALSVKVLGMDARGVTSESERVVFFNPWSSVVCLSKRKAVKA